MDLDKAIVVATVVVSFVVVLILLVDQAGKLVENKRRRSTSFRKRLSFEKLKMALRTKDIVGIRESLKEGVGDLRIQDFQEDPDLAESLRNALEGQSISNIDLNEVVVAAKASSTRSAARPDGRGSMRPKRQVERRLKKSAPLHEDSAITAPSPSSGKKVIAAMQQVVDAY